MVEVISCLLRISFFDVTFPISFFIYCISSGYYVFLFTSDNRLGKAHREPDQTLEVLMMNLDPEKMKWFYKEVCPTAAEATKVKLNF